MQQIPPHPLPPRLQAHLQGEQRKVDLLTAFQAKVDEAKRLWKNKKNSATNASFINDIYNTLAQMNISVRVCNYCEANEADDIEHIYPKSFFPERAFVWENYLLACKSCNTHWKLDKCYILNGCSSTVLTRGTIPNPSSEIAFINPRTENPNNFLLYDFRTGNFIVHDGLDCQAQEKANKTLEILGLNNRDTLRHSRQEAYKNFYDKLSRLQRAKRATTHNELADCFYPNETDFIDFDEPIPAQVGNFENSIRASIQRSRHRAVWYAIKTHYRTHNPVWHAIFTSIPAAVHW